MSTLDELRAEYEARRHDAGPLLLGEVYRAVRIVVRSFDPRRFSATQSWDDAAIDDVVQDTVERLIYESATRRRRRHLFRGMEGSDPSPGRQLDYIFDVSIDQRVFDRLLRREVRRAIVSAERKSVVSRLLERSETLLREESNVELKVRPKRWIVAGRSVESRQLTEDELYAIGSIVSAIPRHKPEREGSPTVYERRSLRRLILSVLEAAPAPVTPADLAWIFRFVLTDWVADVLDQDDVPENEAPGLTPELQTIADETAAELRARLDPRDVKALCMRLHGASWREVEAVVGLSRQRMSLRLSSARQVLSEHLDMPDAVVSSAVLEALCVEEP